MANFSALLRARSLRRSRKPEQAAQKLGAPALKPVDDRCYVVAAKVPPSWGDNPAAIQFGVPFLVLTQADKRRNHSYLCGFLHLKDDGGGGRIEDSMELFLEKQMKNIGS